MWAPGMTERRRVVGRKRTVGSDRGDALMSNHFTGLSLGPPLGDQRLDLCDLYAFGVPGNPSRTVLILNANLNADALHPDAIYRLNIDSDGDYLADVAFSGGCL